MAWGFSAGILLRIWNVRFIQQRALDWDAGPRGLMLGGHTPLMRKQVKMFKWRRVWEKQWGMCEGLYTVLAGNDNGTHAEDLHPRAFVFWAMRASQSWAGYETGPQVLCCKMKVVRKFLKSLVALKILWFPKSSGKCYIKNQCSWVSKLGLTSLEESIVTFGRF